jgi:hypothetical protein
VQSFVIDWANLTDDLVLTNSADSNTAKYQYSLDNITFHSLAVGASFVVSALASGTQTVYYKLVSATASVEPGTLYRAFWDLSSDSITERLTLWCTLKETSFIDIGTTDNETLGNDVNVNDGETTYNENQTTTLL